MTADRIHLCKASQAMQVGLEEKVKSKAGETPTSKRQTQDEERRSKKIGEQESKGVLETDVLETEAGLTIWRLWKNSGSY